MTSTAYLDEVLDALWPGRVHGGTARSVRDLVILPGARSCLLVPCTPARVGAAALRNYNTAQVGASRAKVLAGSLALRLGAARVLPRRVALGAAGLHGIDEMLSTCLGRPLCIAVYLGPPRTSQKPVIQVLTPDGKTVGFAKVGLNARTDRLVEHESAVLQRLSTISFVHLRVPRVLHHGLWNDHQLLVVEPFAHTVTGPASRELLEAAVTELFNAFGSVVSPVGASGFVRELHGRTKALAADVHGPARRLVRQAESRTGSHRLHFGAAHGDWTSWNMTGGHGDLLVWDWEGFRSEVPFGFDVLHHEVNRAISVRGMLPRDAMRRTTGNAAALLHPLGIDARSATVTALWYVLDLATRYAADGEDALAGTALSRLEGWFEPVATELLLRCPGSAAA